MHLPVLYPHPDCAKAEVADVAWAEVVDGTEAGAVHSSACDIVEVEVDGTGAEVVHVAHITVTYLHIIQGNGCA
jgi:hypothetical protein